MKGFFFFAFDSKFINQIKVFIVTKKYPQWFWCYSCWFYWCI